MLKLVRIDDENRQIIELSEGKQVIGREQLACEDKRISRSHAELEAIGDAVIIKALHTNPCFYINKDMAGAEIIKQNCNIKGVVGGVLGFLPDKFCFEIVNKDVDELKTSNIRDFLSVKNIISIHNGIVGGMCGMATVNGLSASTIFDQICNTVSEDDVEIKKEEKTAETDETATVKTSETGEESPESVSILSQLNEKSSQAHSNDEETSQTPGKRCLLKQEPTSPIDIKKVKTDENEPNSSGGQASSSGASSTASEKDASPSKDKPRKRERCMYGANCYRKNSQHKEQFSHPADSDWGNGAQAQCPWGYACARRDPRHWRDHSHPYGMHPPPPTGKRKKRVRKNSDEESPSEALIVTGKRVRKVLKRETWIDSESEEDPYQTDDSDDWTPPSDLTESQDYSQLSQID